MRRLRLVIADDHEVVRKGIRSLLDSRADWEVCAEAATGAEAVEFVRRFKPDVLVLDISMPDRNGIEVTRAVRRDFPETEVLVLTMHESPTVVGEALAAGARGMVYKSDAGRDLINAVEAVSQKKAFVSSRVTDQIVKSGIPKPEGLTDREIEVLRLLALGKNVKEVAADLGISPKTVNVHRSNIMEKLNLRSQTELIFFAIRNKIIEI